MSSAAKLFLLAALASTAAAHGTVPGIVADGVYKGGWLLQYFYAKANGQAIPESVGWYAEDLDNGFVDGTTYATADIICHKNAAPANFTATVAAGGKVDFQWTVWPDSHIGPILTYVANCGGNCSSVDKTALKWVKIDEAGIDLSTQTWPTAGMIKNNNTWTVTVPSTLAAGSYVFRHEIIAMHAAGSLNGAQNYPQCVNIEVTGSGTENPEGTLGTELYKNTDPGIMFNPYTTLTSYTIPGPALFGSGSGSGGSGSGSGGGAATSAAAVPATSQAAASPTPATSAAAQPAPTAAETTAAAASPTTLATVTRVASTAAAAAPTTVGKVAMYQQCGGINFSGSTECVDGAVCKDWNPYYSQCIAA